MSDRRHQKDGRSNWSKDFQAVCKNIYGEWKFYKMNLTTGSTETVKEVKARMEINTANLQEPIIRSVRFSPIRRKFFTEKGLAYFSRINGGDVDEFSAIDEMKRGAKIYTPDFVYWAEHFKPMKAQAEIQSLRVAA